MCDSSRTAGNTAAGLRAERSVGGDRGNEFFSYLLVTLRVVLPSGPGSGSNHPAPQSLSVLLRDTATQQGFELW